MTYIKHLLDEIELVLILSSVLIFVSIALIVSANMMSFIL